MSENYTLEAVKQYNAELILPIADMLAQLTDREEHFGEK